MKMGIDSLIFKNKKSLMKNLPLKGKGGSKKRLLRNYFKANANISEEANNNSNDCGGKSK